MKFSECVEGLLKVWIDWDKHNNIAVSDKYSYSERRKAAIKAESILGRRYYLIDQINKLFEECEEK